MTDAKADVSVTFSPDSKEETIPNASIEEGVPQDKNGTLKNRSNRLSATSKKYDIDGDGVLDETEQAMRDLDSSNRGFITNEKVYRLMQEQLKTQQDLLNAKRLLMFFGAFTIILALATMGTAFAAAKLAQETETSGNVLVVKGSGEVVATGHQGEVIEVTSKIDSSGRQLEDFTATGVEISRSDARRMRRQCDNAESVNVVRTWEGYDDVSATISVCPGGGFSTLNKVTTFILLNSRTLIRDCSASGSICYLRGDGFKLELGAPCVADGDCASGLCTGGDPGAFTPGQCTCPSDIVTGAQDSCAFPDDQFTTCSYVCNYQTKCDADTAAANAGIQWPAFPAAGSCSPPIAIGRPFIDKAGNSLQADGSTSTPSSWSLSSSDNHQSEQLTLDQDHHRQKMLGQEWKAKALGEHASVASFAAFTVALMSNNAPPDLVRDSLVAGLDEVRHAETSFEVASALLGTTVEPGPLPPSSHEFGQDMTALAIATAREGCVDETLSALEAVAEAEEYETMAENSIISTLHLKEKTSTIALEEANHSALAWRTIRWVCSTDAIACEAVHKAVLEPLKLKEVYHQRFPDPSARNFESEWKRIYESLIPLMTANAGDDCMTKEGLDNVGSEAQGLAHKVVDKIIKGVLSCPDRTAQYPSLVNHTVTAQEALECPLEDGIHSDEGLVGIAAQS